MSDKIAGVILAAGESTRFGSPKQLLDINGELLINRIIRIASSSNLDYIVVVLGSNFDEIKQKVKPVGKLVIAKNENWKLGQSTSLQCGIKNILSDSDAIMYLLGDQPFITDVIINRLLLLYSKSKKDVAMLQTKGKRTPPIIFSKNCFGSIMKLEGDMGARNIVSKFDTIYLNNSDENIIEDIDTVEDYNSLKMRIAKHSN